MNNEFMARVLKSKARRQSYIIPAFDVTAWSAFTNQPANDGVEIVSSSSSDTGKCTIWGTTNGTSTVVSETVTLTGTTPKATTKTDWGNIYGIFLGDIDGQNITPAVGTITIREASADQTITTIAATKISKGMVNSTIPNKNITLDTLSGNVWERTATWATSLTGKLLTSGKPIDMNIPNTLSMISDVTGATADIIVWE